MSKKVIIGLSGGIDSSMSAYLLKQDGYEVEGIYMKLHNLIENYHENNLKIIDQVAKYLNIKYHIIDLTDQFKDDIYDYFVQSYIDGFTPNPCVKCNAKIKFGKLIDEAKKLGGDFLATGHYAKTDGKFIYKADDLSKDQSYFLAQINKDAIPYIMFPISKYTKETLRNKAKTIPALNDLATKKDSQEICFVQTVYTDILKKHINIDKQGDTLDKQGNVIGHHKGYMHYTIGKRRGFYVHGASVPHFVLSQDKHNNTITVGTKEDLKVTKIKANQINMFVDKLDFECEVKVRFRSKGIKCRVIIDENNIANILLYKAIYGVAIGQTAVFYDGDKLIGSGWIIDTSLI